MPVLDCSSIESTKNSLCRLLGWVPQKLNDSVNRCAEIADTMFEVKACTETDRQIPMLRHLTGKVDCSHPEGRTYWFHATRTTSPATFAGGIHCDTSFNVQWD